MLPDVANTVKENNTKNAFVLANKGRFFDHTFIQHLVCASKLNNLFGFLVLRDILLSYVSPSELIYLNAEQVLYMYIEINI